MVEENTSLLPSEAEEKKEQDPQKSKSFERLVRHYLWEDQLPSSSETVGQFLGLSIIALSGASPYAAPAKKYIDNPDAWLVNKNPWLVVIGMCFPCAAVLYVATDTFLKWRASERLPGELNDILVKLKSRNAEIREDIVIVGVSFLSAIPLATTFLSYNLHAHWSYLLAMGAVVQFDNTVLHFLPIKLMKAEPIYRLPFLPFEWLYQYAQTRCYPQSLSDEADSQRTAISNHFRAILHKRLARLHYDELASAVTPENGCLLRYRVEPSAMMKHISEYTNTHPNEIYRELLSQLGELSTEPTVSSNRCVQDMARTAVMTTGTLLTMFSVTGYVANPFTLLNGLLKNKWLSGGLVALPTYSFGVLLSFFGKNFSLSNYEFLKKILTCSYSLPLEGKLYPKTFLLLQLFNVYIALYCHSAATQMFYDNFDIANEQLQLTLNALIIAGITPLTLAATTDFFVMMLRKYALTLGGEREHQLIRFDEKMQQLENAVSYLSTEALQELLSDPQSIEPLFGLSAEQLEVEKDDVAAHHSSAPSPSYLRRCVGSIYSFFGRRSADDDAEQPLFTPQRRASFSGAGV